MSGLFVGTPLERPVTCEHCGRTLDACVCARNVNGDVCPPSAQDARVRRERRRGKVVTVVAGLDPVASDLDDLLKTFRKQCATGGTTTDDGFELQGDHRDRLVDALRERGYPAKAAGG